MEVFSKLHGNHKTSYLLESIEGPRRLAEYSFIGFDPSLTVTIKNEKAITRNERTGEELSRSTGNPLDIVRRLVKDRTVSSKEFRLVGGAVGYFSYDAIRYWEKLPEKAPENPGFPDVEFGLFEDGIVFDHGRKRAFYYYLNESRLAEINEAMKKDSKLNPFVYTQLTTNISKKQFMKIVKKAKDYVARGHIFQVVLSKRYEMDFEGDLIGFYRSLRQINPSPYMYFLKMGDRQIVGSSPEMLVRVENNVVETFPIAGTRPSASNSHENRRLAKELLTDPKERAEHVMLVDLARNDLGKISKFSSVKVTEFMKAHRYSHVQHLVSRVEGRIKDNLDCFDALRAVFPAGTVSGAPKIRAMEIIEELESERRGPYAGAVGYFSYNGNADFAITIRTLFANKNNAFIQTGAGIVADSVPETEWFETEHKADALMMAMENCRGKT